MEQLWNLLGEFLMQLFLALGTVALGIAIAWVRKNTSKQQRELVESIIVEGVKYAQESYAAEAGTERLVQAKRAVLRELDKVGIKLTEEQLDVKIHAVLKELKKEFGDQWKEE